MAKFRFTPYDRLSLKDSMGLAFRCVNGDTYKVGYNARLSGPEVLAREGERLVWTLFFGGIPRYMQEWEIKDRRDTTLKRMADGEERIINEIIDCAEKVSEERVDAVTDKEAQERRQAIIKEALYDPKESGLVEHLIRPQVGMHLASGVLVFNSLTTNEDLKSRLRIVISKTPIAEIYCLPE